MYLRLHVQRCVWKNGFRTIQKSGENSVLLISAILGRIKWVPPRSSELSQLLWTVWVLQVVLAAFLHFAKVVPKADVVKRSEIC